MNYDLVLKVSSAISTGHTLRTSTHVVGPDERECWAPEIRFSCRLHSGLPLVVWEECSTQRRRDWSAFAAARAFVEAHEKREREVENALFTGAPVITNRFQRIRRKQPVVEVIRIRPNRKVQQI